MDADLRRTCENAVSGPDALGRLLVAYPQSRTSDISSAVELIISLLSSTATQRRPLELHMVVQQRSVMFSGGFSTTDKKIAGCLEVLGGTNGCLGSIGFSDVLCEVVSQATLNDGATDVGLKLYILPGSLVINGCPIWDRDLVPRERAAQ